MIIQLRNIINRFAKSQRGVAAIEFALVLPVMAMIYFGMLDLTNFVTVNRRVTAASSVVSDLINTNRDTITKASIDDYYNAAYLMLKPIPAASVHVKVNAFQNVGGTVSQRWHEQNDTADCGTAPTASDVSSLTSVDLKDINGNAIKRYNDIIVTRVCVTYKPLVGAFLGANLLGDANITLVKNIYQRPRQSDVLACATCTAN